MYNLELAHIHYRAKQLLKDNQNVAIFGMFFFISLALMSIRLLQDPAPVGDADQTWRAFANAILSGDRPYADVWDNKPPLWHLITVNAAFTSLFIPTLWGLITVANAVTSYFVYRLSLRHNLGFGAVLAGILTLSIFHVGHGWHINPRLVALPLIFAAFLTRKPIRIGALLAVACLLIQYAGISIPVVVWYHHQRGFDMSVRAWLARFAGAGVVIASISYGTVLVVWGIEAFTKSLELTLLEAESYQSRLIEDNRSGFAAPTTMIRTVYDRLANIQPWFLLAALEIIAIFIFDENYNINLLSFCSVLLLAGFSLQFLWAFKGPRMYSLLMPFIALLGAAGAVRLIRTIE